MRIRKVETLYTIKTKTGLIPKGVYSVDSPRGIPKVVLEEAERGSNIVKILAFDREVEEVAAVKSEGPEAGETTMLDEGKDSVNLEPESEKEPEPKEKPKPKRRVTRKKKEE